MAISSIHEIIEYDISGSMEADMYSYETQKLQLVRYLNLFEIRKIYFHWPGTGHNKQ